MSPVDSAPLSKGFFEASFESRHAYEDPFNDVEVDVVFSRDKTSWRVPAFWRGGQRWSVRFRPPEPGAYRFHLESSDRSNPDLNHNEGTADIAAYSGSSTCLARGPLRLSANRRYFEHADGTPFYWLGDTWWTGLSDRLSWEGFQKLTADRKAKGFTLVQLVAGLVPVEELAPLDPGFHNEGGFVWEREFARINPAYFDYADRRIEHLLQSDLLPAIVGAWNQALAPMGVAKMKQHWRYLIARYGAYPVLWLAGGEVRDPPDSLTSRFPASSIARGWTEVTRYIREVDPYHHPITVHESQPPWDASIRDESLIDFDMIQPSHFGWPSIATEVMQLNLHYARTSVTKPVVQGEVGYERLGETHLEDFQRVAFWLAMLNGAAGHTYGANGTWESYTADKPFHRLRWSFMSWEEGMNLPGSWQVGLAAKLLRNYPWWRFAPHPEWITPRGTTLLEPRSEINEFEIAVQMTSAGFGDNETLESEYPGGEWRERGGTFRRPYAAGIPGEVRVIYIPTQIGFRPADPPTVLRLEAGVRYHAYFWEPCSGTRFDLGLIERPAIGPKLFPDSLQVPNDAAWIVDDGDETSMRLKDVSERNAVAKVQISNAVHGGILLRHRDSRNYIAAVYSPEENSLYVLELRDGEKARVLGRTTTAFKGPTVWLTAEVREDKAIASATDGQNTFTTPIVDLLSDLPGTAGLFCRGTAKGQCWSDFELYRSAPLAIEEPSATRRLIDARGQHRGDLVGPGLDLPGFKVAGWSRFGRDKHLLLDAYRPERLPACGDWVLVLEAQSTGSN